MKNYTIAILSFLYYVVACGLGFAGITFIPASSVLALPFALPFMPVLLILALEGVFFHSKKLIAIMSGHDASVWLEVILSSFIFSLLALLIFRVSPLQNRKPLVKLFFLAVFHGAFCLGSLALFGVIYLSAAILLQHAK